MTKKEQILKTALTLFIENGLEKTPTSLISKEAGVATGTLFHHFKTKEDLVNALYLEIKFKVHEAIAESIENAEDIQAKIHALWFNFISWVLKNPDEYRFIIQFGESSLITNSTREKAEAAFQETKVFFEDGMKQGVFFNFSLDFLMTLLTSHMFASCNYFLENPNFWEEKAFRNEVFTSCWNSIAKNQ